MASLNPTLQQFFFTPENDFLASTVYISWAGHRFCEPGHHIGPRVLEGYKLVFVIRGQGTLIQGNDEPVPLKQGDMFFLFPKERHEYWANPEDPWELMWVNFRGSISSSLVEDLNFTHENYIRKNVLNSSIKKTLTTLVNALGDTEDTLRLAATGQFYILLAYLKQATGLMEEASETTSSASCVSKAARFIEQNYYIDIDVQTLCEYVNYSRSYLSRIFRQETGLTIPEYTNKIRMENAMELLRDTSLPLKEVATSVGINDTFYFSKLFKKHTGKTPRGYRLSFREE